MSQDPITPPPDVQKAIDDSSRMGVFKDMEKLMQMKAAMAMEKASQSDGGGSSGMGTSLALVGAYLLAGELGSAPAELSSARLSIAPGTHRHCDQFSM